MSQTWNRYLQKYFDQAATRYAEDIAPALRPLAQELIRLASIRQGERALDLGAGTGVVGRLALRATSYVVAVDFSYPMLQHSEKDAGIKRVQADMHDLCFGDASFDCALASFAFNSGDPIIALAEAFRVLAPGGRLVLQEWGATDELTSLVSETVAAYSVDEPTEELAELREAISQPTPWDDIESLDDLVAAINAAGFAPEPPIVTTQEIEFQGVEAFIRYKFAWPSHHAEFLAMSPETRSLCANDLRENLQAFVNASGALVWQPEIIRILAYRQSH